MTTLIPQFDLMNGGTTPTGAVNRPINQKLAESVSVLDFGAVGDGVTDDTVAIQAAVTAAAGKSLYIPAGTYLISAVINVSSNTYIYGDPNNTTLKIYPQAYTANGPRLVTCANKSNITYLNIVFDGNAGNVGTLIQPVTQVFNSTNVSYKNCTFQNCEGIAINASTSTNDISVLNCIFNRCGGLSDNSLGYRKQAIAFTNSSTNRTINIKIINCSFKYIGLDAISLQNCDNVNITSNLISNSYVFVFNVHSGSFYSSNVNITDNIITNISQGTYASSSPPGGLDLGGIVGGVISNNTFNTIDTSAIGIFSGSSNIVIGNNVIINPFNYTNSTLSFTGAISFGAISSTLSNIKNIVVTNNVIIDTRTTPLMPFGFVLETDATNLFVSGNTILNAVRGHFGYYVYPDGPSPSSTSVLTSNTPLTSSVVMVDLDNQNSKTTNYRNFNTLTSYSVNGTQVVTSQQPAIANGSDSTVNSILGALRTHGLIAT